MQLKTFSARSMAAILTQIKEELGSDAVILDTQEEGGLITVTAARERANPAYRKEDNYQQIGQARNAFENAFAKAFAESGPATEVSLGKSEEPFGTATATAAARAAYQAALSKTSLNADEERRLAAEGELGRVKAQKISVGTKERPAVTVSSAYAPATDTASRASNLLSDSVGVMQWQEEWSSIKNHLLALMKPTLKLEDLPPRQRLAIEFLQREGVNDHAVLELYTRLRDMPAASILEPLSKMVPLRKWSEKSWPQKLHIIAGPFGAGKTSVAIRLALALRRKNQDMRICLVNADASRGNGRLLLRHYAELSEMAYKEAASTIELVAALSAAQKEGYDRVFVDLPGLSRGKHLKTLLADAGLGDGWESAGGGFDMPLAVHLCLSPHYGEEQLRGLFERYRTGHRGSIVWTKLDEAEHYGQIVNVALLTGLPVSALSYGAGLGNSLEAVRETVLWKLIFKRELP